MNYEFVCGGGELKIKTFHDLHYFIITVFYVMDFSISFSYKYPCRKLRFCLKQLFNEN